MKSAITLFSAFLVLGSGCVPFSADMNSDGADLSEAAAKGGVKGKPGTTPAPTVAPTATPRPTLAPTVAPQPTVAPTATPAPTAVPTPTATPVQSPAGLVPAFPGAQGGGAISKGGRGGRIIEVTTLADALTAPAGSLRACVQATGARTCVFRVGGTISLVDRLIINNPYLTVAGQTAPGGGIQLSGVTSPGDLIDVRTHDVIWRYTRLRHGYNVNTPDQGGDTIVMRDGSQNIIFDHNSIMWGQDENLDIWTYNSAQAPKNITISWNVLGEPFERHPTNTMIGGAQGAVDFLTDIDYHHNYLPNTGHRNPLFKGARCRWINNIIYNWDNFANEFGGGADADVISNIYKSGPLGGGYIPGSTHEIQWFPTSGSGSTEDSVASGTPTFYVSGNKGPNHPDPLALSTEWNDMVREITREGGAEIAVVATSFRRSSPMAAAGVPIAAEAVSSLEGNLFRTVGASQRLDCSGGWVGVRDAADNRLINDYNTFTGDRPTSETAVGGFPVIAGGTPCADADRDGMPDAFETVRGLNPTDPLDGDAIGSDGFTNVERYLNGN